MGQDSGGKLHTVFVASAEVLAAWSERTSVSSDVLTLDESDPQHIIDVIARRRPSVVVVERRFLTTSRGAALVHRIRHDDDLPRVEIRVLPTEHAVTLTTTHSPLATSPTAVVSLAQPITGPVRRAERMTVPDGVHVQIDGRPAGLIDLSTLGAQIVSARSLRPNQRVRLQLADESGIVVRVHAGIAWSAFELPPGGSPRYRAGIEFRDGDPAAIEAFYERLASSAAPGG